MLRNNSVTLSTIELADLWRKLEAFTSYVADFSDDKGVEDDIDPHADFSFFFEHYFYTDLRGVEFRQKVYGNVFEGEDSKKYPYLSLSDRQIRFLIQEEIWDIHPQVSWSVDHDDILEAFDEWLSSHVLPEPSCEI